MNQLIKITGFIIVMSAIVVFSEQIQHEIIERYNHYVELLANRTLTSTGPTGF